MFEARAASKRKHHVEGTHRGQVVERGRRKDNTVSREHLELEGTRPVEQRSMQRGRGEQMGHDKESLQRTWVSNECTVVAKRTR